MVIYWLVIFTEITDKYRKKVAKLEEQINNILHEEWEERVMQRTENQANRAEKILKKEGVGEMPRSWFQSHKQREDEKGTSYKNALQSLIFCIFWSTLWALLE